MTRVLITGITGQDGSYLAERLASEGSEVHGLVAPSSSNASTAAVPSKAELHRGDLREAGALERVLDRVRPEEVYHLGGPTSVAQSWEHPVHFAEAIGLASARLFSWLAQQKAHPQPRVVLASSAEVFGQPAQSPQDESTPLRPMSPYGAAKAFAQNMATVFRHRGLHVSTLILYNHESPRRPAGFVTRKVTSTVAAIARGEATELVLGDLEARRDWGWAPDYVDAMVRAIRAAEPSDYVIATGRTHSVRDFVAAAFHHVGIHDWSRFVRVDPAFLRPVDPTQLVGDASRASRMLGWSPTVTFAEIVGRMVDSEGVSPLK